jgi:hypothetical protein
MDVESHTVVETSRAQAKSPRKGYLTREGALGRQQPPVFTERWRRRSRSSGRRHRHRRCRRFGGDGGVRGPATSLAGSGRERPTRTRDKLTQVGRARETQDPPVTTGLRLCKRSGLRTEYGCSSLKCGLQKSVGCISDRSLVRGREARARVRSSQVGAEGPLTRRRGASQANGCKKLPSLRG